MAQNIQNLNQFRQTPMIGQLDMLVNNNVLACRIYSGSVATVLTAGQAMKLVDQVGEIPVIDIAAVTDKVFGFIVHNMKGDTFVKGDVVDLALKDSVMYMQASAAIARGAKVQVDVTGPTVATLTSLATNCQVGISLDKPSAAGAMTRVLIDPQDANLSAY
jgi:hypothetical protein